MRGLSFLQHDFSMQAGETIDLDLVAGETRIDAWLAGLVVATIAASLLAIALLLLRQAADAELRLALLSWQELAAGKVLLSSV